MLYLCLVASKLLDSKNSKGRCGWRTTPLSPSSTGNLCQVTKNFSEKLRGGGFGFMFKGTMLDSTQVATKKLKGIFQLGGEEIQDSTIETT
ncbi:hypothetical protein Taro_037666 [Colocasia esculenta]|uniref:Uncharacterized protein n=1 Tax=Colocasia esculenta TaxID=4460 RepID=A0A843WQD3_COLES|nr:hypothetical protein [Colocasia esculenta]